MSYHTEWHFYAHTIWFNFVIESLCSDRFYRISYLSTCVIWFDFLLWYQWHGGTSQHEWLHGDVTVCYGGYVHSVCDSCCQCLCLAQMANFDKIGHFSQIGYQIGNLCKIAYFWSLKENILYLWRRGHYFYQIGIFWIAEITNFA